MTKIRFVRFRSEVQLPGAELPETQVREAKYDIQLDDERRLMAFRSPKHRDVVIVPLENVLMYIEADAQAEEAPVPTKAKRR